MKKISIVIVTYNSSKDLHGCLTSIVNNNDIGDELEVIVVDNNSTDRIESKEIANKIIPNVIFIENKTNGGYGSGNNVGIVASSAPIVLIMNPDVRLFKPIFKDAILKYDQISNLALLGMTQYESLGKKGNSYLPLGHSLGNLLRYLYYKKKDKYNPKYMFISGACFFIRKSMFDQIGCFDENIFLYGEEYDINYRLRGKNFDIIYDNTLGYIHPTHNRKYSIKLEEISYKSFLYTRQKHAVNIKKELLNNLLYLYIMCFRAFLKGDNESIKSYKERISFYKKKYNLEKER